MRALGDVPDLQQVLVHTGQHYDARMSDTFVADLDLPRPNHFLGAGSGTHAEQTARVMIALEPVLAAEAPDLVLVPGDVNSTLAAALTAAKVDIPVAHLEAGLRSWDRSMPEEHNRVLTDHLAELLLTPTRVADENLVNEGIARDKIAFVGNTMIDSLRAHEAAARRLNVPAELEIEDYVVVTLHRPGLVDRPDRFEPVLETLETIAESRAVVYPMHPRSRRRLKEAGWSPRRLRLLEPQSYLRFLALMLDAYAVITDSGGDPGRDHSARSTLLHAQGEHRAADHHRARHQHAPWRGRPRVGKARRSNQDSVAAQAQADPEVRAWIAALTPCQRDPSAAGCVTSASAFAPLTGAGAAVPDDRTLFRGIE